MSKLPPVKPMREESDQGRNNDKYCEYHKDWGHTTRDHKHLAKAINQIMKEHEGQELLGPSEKRQEYINYPQLTNNKGFEEEQVEDINFVIMGGEDEGQSNKGIKRTHVDGTLSFSEKDLVRVNINISHQDHLVIVVFLENTKLLRVLIDIGASIDILY